MPIFYLFLYVFSLSIPLFYHSAFFVGLITTFHLLLKSKDDKNITLTVYQFGYILLFLLGYPLVALIVMIHGTYDFSFFKTFTNSFLSALCAIPLVRFYQLRYRHSITVLLSHIYILFLIQSIIILLVILIPELKPTVTFFHRNTDSYQDIDVFSGGLRSNALSGGLYFGLSLSFSFALLCHLYQQSISKMKMTFTDMIYFIIVNVGLICTGRFGFIYIISSVFILFSSHFFIRIKTLLRFIVILSLSTLAFYFLYSSVGLIRGVVDNKIYPYFFEIIQVYVDSGKLETASTNELSYMYSINAAIDTWLWGDGFYTGSDGLYYKHTDVGYTRILLLGGLPLLSYILIFFLYSIRPLAKYGKNNRSLYFAILTLFVLAQFKGEAMITLVSINNMVFVLCSLISLEKPQKTLSVTV